MKFRKNRKNNYKLHLWNPLKTLCFNNLCSSALENVGSKYKLCILYYFGFPAKIWTYWNILNFEGIINGEFKQKILSSQLDFAI